MAAPTPSSLGGVWQIRLLFILAWCTDSTGVAEVESQRLAVEMTSADSGQLGLMPRKIGSGCSAGNTDMVSQPAFSRDSR